MGTGSQGTSRRSVHSPLSSQNLAQTRPVEAEEERRCSDMLVLGVSEIALQSRRRESRDPGSTVSRRWSGDK